MKPLPRYALSGLLVALLVLIVGAGIEHDMATLNAPSPPSTGAPTAPAPTPPEEPR